MRLTVILFLSFIFNTSAFPVFAQNGAERNTYSDSLIGVLQKQKSDTAKADVLNKMSDYFSYTDSVKAIRYALQSLQLSKGNTYYTALAHFYIAGVYFDSDPNKSEKEYLTTIDLLKNDSSINALRYQARAWHNYGVLLQKNNDNKGFADVLLNKAIPLSLQAKDTLRTAVNYHDVGLVFMNLLEYDKAISYYNISIVFLKYLNKSSEELAAGYTDIAKTLIFQNKFEDARRFIDSAWRILKPLENSFYRLDYFIVQGMYYYHIRQWLPAFKSLDTALNLARKFNSRYDVYRIVYEKYKAYKEQGNYTEAKKQLLEAFGILKVVSTDGNRLQLLYELSQVEEKLGNIKSAYSWLSQYAALADSVFDKKSKAEISGLENKIPGRKKAKANTCASK